MNSHSGSKLKHESIDIENIINKSDCAKEYFRLEDCLGENDRSWSKCQGFVKILKDCKMKNQRKARSSF